MAFRRLWLGWQAVQLARAATGALPAHAQAPVRAAPVRAAPVRAGMQVIALGVAAAACVALAWLALLATIVLAFVGDGWWISLAAGGGLVALALVLGALAGARWRAARTVLDRLGAERPRAAPGDDVLDGVARPVDREPGAP